MGEFVLNVNGAQLHVNAPAEETLLSVLRNRLNLTGTKYGCGEGQCGACTVLLNGRATRSCLISVGSAVNAKIVTIEGLETDGKLSSVQQAFLDEGAFQCGYCTSGQICSAAGMLAESRAGMPSYVTVDLTQTQSALTDAEIRERMSGNICRCAAYPNIVAAIRQAAGVPA